MPGQPTTKLQASGHRFLTRRLQLALLTGDVDGANDPVRAQSMALGAGVMLAAVVAAAAVVLAFVRPHGALGEARIALDRESGALYVRVDDVLHPVFNLASARLIAGADDSPVAVAPAELGSLRRGPLVGIPGAPAVVAPPLSSAEAGWAVCDEGSPPARTVVVAAASAPTEGQHPVLVTTGTSEPTYLIYDGYRAAVDVDDAAVRRALQLEAVEPRRVSPSLLNVLPELPPLVTPQIADVGAASLAGFEVGTVITTNSASGAEYFVVLADGVQRVGQVVADLLRFADSRGEQAMVSVALDAVAQLPEVESLSIATYPERITTPTGAGGELVACVYWQPTGTAVRLGESLPVPEESVMVPVQADGPGPGVDGVAVPAGRSAFVSTAGHLHLVTETGVCFGIDNATDAAHLGLSEPAVAAPSAIVQLLPRGPELSRANALVARDSVWGAGVPVDDDASPAP